MYYFHYFSETCRCPRELRADWWVHPPYTVLTNQSSASGIIPDFLMGMVQDLCGVCPSHGHTNIDFKIKSFMKKRSTSDTTKVEEADLIFPVGRFQGWETFKGYNYIPLVSVPGFALMKAGKKSHVAFVGKAAAKSLFDCWPYFFIYTSMMILAGIVIWILVGNPIFDLYLNNDTRHNALEIFRKTLLCHLQLAMMLFARIVLWNF